MLDIRKGEAGQGPIATACIAGRSRARAGLKKKERKLKDP